MFWRLTYISTIRCDDLGGELTAILDSSRNHNAANAITGVLLVAGGSFYQTIEGDRDDVAETFMRIRGDTRHDNIIVLQDEATSHRAFAAWSMAHRDLPTGHKLARKLARLSAGDKPAFRTLAAARDLDILITSFLAA